MHQYIGGAIAESNILSRHRLLILLSQAETEIVFFTQKLHVQIANNPRSALSQTDAQ